MKKILAFILCGALILSILPIAISAADAQTISGYVEYSVDASVNFNDVISVTLVNIENGDTHTHDLHRINKYTGNFKIPFGSYRVYAKVISINEESQEFYRVDAPKGLIAIDNPKIAVPIKLTVNEFTPIEIPTSDATNTTESEEINTQEEVTVPGSSAVDTVTQDVVKTPEESEKDTSSTDSAQNDTNTDDHSFLKSTLFYGALLALLSIGYVVYKRKFDAKR